LHCVGFVLLILVRVLLGPFELHSNNFISKSAEKVTLKY